VAKGDWMEHSGRWWAGRPCLLVPGRGRSGSVPHAAILSAIFESTCIRFQCLIMTIILLEVARSHHPPPPTLLLPSSLPNPPALLRFHNVSYSLRASLCGFLMAASLLTVALGRTLAVQLTGGAGEQMKGRRGKGEREKEERREEHVCAGRNAAS